MDALGSGALQLSILPCQRRAECQAEINGVLLRHAEIAKLGLVVEEYPHLTNKWSYGHGHFPASWGSFSIVTFMRTKCFLRLRA